MRYYQPTESQFLDDAMYQHPVELMAAAVQANDKRYNDFQDTQDELGKLIDLKPHEKDSEEARKISSDLRGRLDELSKEADKGDTPISKINQKSRELGREITRQTTDGDIYHINKANEDRNKLYQATLKNYRENPKQYEFINDESEIADLVDSQYQGYKSEEGNYNPFPEFTLAGRDADFDVISSVFREKVGKDFTGRKNTSDLIIDFQKEGFSTKEISDAIEAYVNSDDTLQKSYMQETELRKRRGETNITVEDVKRENVAKLTKLGEALKLEQTTKWVESRKEPKEGSGAGKDSENSYLGLSKSISTYFENPYHKQGVVNPIQLIGKESSIVKELDSKIQEKANEVVKETGYTFKDGVFYDGSTPLSASEALSEVFTGNSLDNEVASFEQLQQSKNIYTLFPHNAETSQEALQYGRTEKITNFSPDLGGLVSKDQFKAVDNSFKRKEVTPNSVKIHRSSVETQLLSQGYVLRYSDETDEEFKERYGKLKEQNKTSNFSPEILNIRASKKSDFVKGSTIFESMSPLLSKETRTLTDKNTQKSGEEAEANPLTGKVGGQDASLSAQVEQGDSSSDTTSTTYEKTEPEFTGGTGFTRDSSDFNTPVASQNVKMGGLEFQVVVDISDIGVPDGVYNSFQDTKSKMLRVKQMLDRHPQGLMGNEGEILFNMVDEDLYISIGEGQNKVKEKISVDEVNGKKYLYRDDKRVTDQREMLVIIDLLTMSY